MLTFRSSVGSIATVFAVLALSACGDDDGNVPDSGLPDMVSAPIGPGGGELSLGDGKVTIPPGALDRTVNIGIGNANDLPDLPEGYTRSGTALAFTPHGTQFLEDVTLEIPYTGSASVLFRLDDPDDTSWDMVSGASFVGGRVTVLVSGFSVYLPARRVSGMIMLDGGGSGGVGGAGSGGVGGAGSGGVGGDAGTGGDAGSGGNAGTSGDLDAGIDDAGFDAAPPCDLEQCGSACVDVTSDPAHCGACDHACAPGEGCIASECVCPQENLCVRQTEIDAGVVEYDCRDLQGDRNNCGACNVHCDTGDHCVAGACVAIECASGLDLCGNDCVNPSDDRDNCGGCGAGGRGEPLPDWYCDESESYTRCGEPSVCVDTGDDRDNCGECGNVCDNDEACYSGSCFTLECASGQIACNGQCIYGDSCGDRCELGFGCDDGQCAPITCVAPLVRCGNDCIDPQDNVSHCGGCGVPSHGNGGESYTCDVEDSECNYYCSEFGGMLCTLVAGSTNVCLDGNIDRDNCGECGNACGEHDECVFGSCQPMVCGAGEVACDGLCVNGTTCGAICSDNASCNAGSCVCDSGAVSCPDHNGGLLCARLSDDDSNCGACGNSCGEGYDCVGGTCEPLPCDNVNEVRCDGSCVDINSDEYNCGGCFVPAPNPQVCPLNECGCEGTQCPVGDGYYACVNTDSSEQHCGECGIDCGQGQACIDGTCTTLDCGTGSFCVDRCVPSSECGVECDVQAGMLCGSGTCYQGT